MSLKTMTTKSVDNVCSAGKLLSYRSHRSVKTLFEKFGKRQPQPNHITFSGDIELLDKQNSVRRRKLKEVKRKTMQKAKLNLVLVYHH